MADNQVRILASIKDEVSGPLGRIIDKFDRLQKQGAKGFAIGVGAFAAAKAFSLLDTAASAAIGAIGDSIEKASDLNETLSKSRVVFGESARTIETWGGSLAKNFAISKQAGIEAAASFGNVFKNLGQTEDAAAKMSIRLVELAGDLASFNNISTDEALDKLRSGLAGEAEPLRRLGVFLTEAKVKAKAMALGLADSNGALSESAKVSARYALILEETTAAQGDFARTADGLANSQRTLNAEWEDASAKLGQALLPIVTQGVRQLSDLLGVVNELSASTPQAAKAGTDWSETWLTSIGDVLSALQHAPWPIGASGQPDWAGGDPFKKLGVSAGKAADDLVLMTGASKKADGAMDDGAKSADQLADELKEVKRKAKEADDAISDLTDTIIDELYGDAVAAGERAELVDQLVDYGKELRQAKRRVEELADIKHPTKAQQRDYADAQREVTILQGKIAGLKGDLLKLDYQIAASKGPEELKKWFDKTWKSVDKADDETKALVDDLYRLAKAAGKLPGVVISVRGGQFQRGKALGGPVHAGEPYVVGEKGPELFVPGASGNIIPNDKLQGPAVRTGGGSSSPAAAINVYVNVTGVMTPAVARQIGDELGPILTDYQYRRGIVTRAA